MDRNESLVYETPKLALEVALLRGFFDSARLLLLFGCATFTGIMDLIKEYEEQLESKDVIADIKRLITDPKSLRFLALCFVRETIAANNVCSVDELNDTVDKLPVINDEIKKDLQISLHK